MPRAAFTSEELAEMAAADAEIEATFRLEPEDIALSRQLDWEAHMDALPPEKQKAAALMKAWYEANREKVLEKKRAYREANREKLAASHRQWYLKNREKVIAYQREYKKRKRGR